MKRQILAVVFLLLFESGFTYSAEKKVSETVSAQVKYGSVLSKTPLVEQIGNLSRLAGYRVVYLYEGKQYTVLMADDPGEQVIIQPLPGDSGSAPVVKAPETTPIKPPTTAEVATALTPPPVIIIGQQIPPVIYTQPPVVYTMPSIAPVFPMYTYPYYGHYYYRPYYPIYPSGYYGYGINWGIRGRIR